MADFQRKTFTVHPIQRYRMPRGRFTFNKGILVIDSQEAFDEFQLVLGTMKVREQRRIREVTAANIAELLAGQNQFPMASQGTDSDTAKMAERALAGDVAKAQIASQKPAHQIGEPVTESDLTPTEATPQATEEETSAQPKAVGLVLPK